jgi:HEAT repeat protein
MKTEDIIGYFNEIPQGYLIAAAVVFLAIVPAIVLLISRSRFMAELKRATTDETALDFVLTRLRKRPSLSLVKNALETLPERTAFTIFLCALERRRVATELLRWISESGDTFVYRHIALSGRGESFDGQKAKELFADQIERIRELTGDPEWPARYLAVKILLHDEQERSKRAVLDMFKDPHTLIRRTLIEEYRFEEHDIYPQLLEFLSDDPAFEVRKSAKKRIFQDFLDRYEVDYSSLSPEQTIHIIEQYDPRSTEDVSRAVKFIEEKNLELRFAACQFLEKTAALEKLFLDVDFEDRQRWKHNSKLLKLSVEVHCDAFLDKLQTTDNPASLSIAAEILNSYGDVSLIETLAKTVFSRKPDMPDERRLFELTVKCIKSRGSQNAVSLLIDELSSRRYKEEDARILLEGITASYPFITAPILLALLKDPQFTLHDELHAAFLKIEAAYYLDELFTILKSERDAFAHSVRIFALLLLGSLKLSYCMQFLLEQMPVLPFEEARDFSVHLKDYDNKLFRERVLDLLAKSDGKVKAALISAVPATEVKDFLAPIREAVGDPDPEVRRASVWALLEYGDQRSIKASLDLLRDPVERVRIEAARALGAKGTSAIVDSLFAILKDDNEVESVKIAAIEGLSESEESKSVDVLVDQLKNRPDELREEVLDALAKKSQKKLVQTLIGQLKDAELQLREAISEAFRRMGESAEAPLLEVLREDIASLTPHITFVLEETGYIEATIRRLNHRDPAVRREAAEILSRLGTLAAFRGIVLASRDPDDDVRVMVTKALERLNTKSGSEILEQLKSDPEKRIRKYTLWAMERLESKND